MCDIEYEDDTEMIPRSTSIIARRLPPAKVNKGSAARYVSGKAPVNARNSSRMENSTSKPASQAQNGTSNSAALSVNPGATEEQRIKAMLALESDMWREKQQEMAK